MPIPRFTLYQLESYLIHHVPLQDSGNNSQPFRVEFKIAHVHFMVQSSTPWDAYHELALSIRSLILGAFGYYIARKMDQMYMKALKR